jgi:7-cyano-7-deazaguanine synthase in queuosine biosynthesis
MAHIGIELRVGSSDSGAGVDTADYKRFYTFYTEDLQQKQNRISFSKFLKSLRYLHLLPSATGLDFLNVAATVYAADTCIERHKYADDSWTRQFHLFIPVSQPALWQSQDALLAEILNFLTGDIWQLTFRQSSENITVTKRNMTPTTYNTDTICLFSGGMDSFLGAMQLLESGKRPLLVGHAKSSDVSEFRNKSATALASRYSTLNPQLVEAYVRVSKPQVGGKSIPGENTERGRSFLFLALGAACASALPTPISGSKKHLYIPENGFITLNLPLTPLRLGAYSTRTTHPYYISIMRRLFDALGLETDIINPFEYQTKGEMLQACADPAFVANVDTMSCSRPATRNATLEGPGKRHCGRCVPCIIRRAALKKAGIADNNSQLPAARQYRTDIYNERLRVSTDGNTPGKGEHAMSLKYLSHRIRTNPNFLTTAIRLTGPLTDAQKSLAVYKRGLAEVEAVLRLVNITN